MIPKLFDKSATTFTTNGIGRLDCISCEVTEERNGYFTLTMVVPTNTLYFDQISEGQLIVVTPNHTQTNQAFEIYEISKPINNRVTVKANHISYRQSYIPVKPFTATGITDTLSGLLSNALESSPFTFQTTITNEESTYNQLRPASLRSRLGGTDGSLLDVFGGEYLWDNFTTHLLLHRGSDNGVELRLGKNITDLIQTKSLENTITGVLPVWMDEDEGIYLYGDIQYSSNVDDYAIHRTIILDLSDQFTEYMPTVNQLNQAGLEYVSQPSISLPSTNIKLSYIDLADTEEGGVLERVNLCDTVKVVLPSLDISYKAKVISYTFDVLRERTINVEIGSAKSTISKTITDLVGDVSSVVKTGKKLISVTQSINRELGEVQTTVASVEEKADTAVSTTSQLQIDLSGIQTQVTDTQTSLENYATKDELAQTSSSLSTSISQTAENITLNINSINNTVTEQGNQLTELNSYFDFTSSGLTIGKSDSEVKLALENDELSFNDNTNKLAWLDSSDGLGASALSIGDANTQANRWRIFTRSNGSHLTFTRHN